MASRRQEQSISKVRSSCGAAGRCWAPCTGGIRLQSPWQYYGVGLLNKDLTLGAQAAAAGQREHLVLEIITAISKFHLNLPFFCSKPGFSKAIFMKCFW